MQLQSRDEAVSEIIKSYLKLNKANPSSYALINEDGLAISQTLEACHYKMAFNLTRRNYWQGLITAYPVKKDLDLEFFQELLVPLYSNWSSCINLKSKDGHYYIEVTDLDKVPANALYNFCIASRIPIEFRTNLILWDKLRKSGLTSRQAFASCKCILPASTPISKLLDVEVLAPFDWTSFGHWPFYISAKLDRLTKTGPSDLSVSYYESPGASAPCNSIWGESQDLMDLKGNTLRNFWKEHE